MGGYVRLLITVSICCCVMGFLMWLFLKCYKKASIWILLLCTGLLLVGSCIRMNYHLHIHYI